MTQTNILRINLFLVELITYIYFYYFQRNLSATLKS